MCATSCYDFALVRMKIVIYATSGKKLQIAFPVLIVAGDMQFNSFLRLLHYVTYEQRHRNCVSFTGCRH